MWRYFGPGAFGLDQKLNKVSCFCRSTVRALINVNFPKETCKNTTTTRSNETRISEKKGMRETFHFFSQFEILRFVQFQSLGHAHREYSVFFSIPHLRAKPRIR